MDIIKYIYDYLKEYSTPVIVPQLGCFTVINKPSEIRDGIVVPPAKTVEFDCENSTDDHVFTLYIAKKENITVEQAEGKVRDFYNQHFKYKLPVERKVAFDDFGVFTLDDSGNILFASDAHLLNDHYGLSDTYLSSSANQNAQPDFIADVPQPTPDIPVLPVEPVIVPEPTQTIPKPEISSTSEGSLFDGTRFRENTERRRPTTEQSEEPVRPVRPSKTPPPPQKRTVQTKTNSHSNLWVLWVVIGALGLGVAGYFIYPRFASPHPTLSAVTDVDKEVDPFHADEPEGDTINTEVAQTLDDATDKKNALNPTQQPATAPMPLNSEPKPTTVDPVQGNTSRGAYLLVVGSFGTHSAAETFGKKLQETGINYEIVNAGNQRYRVSVAGFDDKAEAIRQANRVKSKPFCENVWVARRN